jgi:hypothetical protein
MPRRTRPVSCLAQLGSEATPPQLETYTKRSALQGTLEMRAVPKINGQWGMLGNYHSGDCALAAAGHAVKVWAAPQAANPPVQTAALSRAYTALKRAAHARAAANPTDPDAGGITANDTLNYWRTEGVAGHRIDAYAALSPDSRGDPKWVRFAISAFGCAYVVFELPNAVVRKGMTPENAPAWTTVTPGPTGEPNPRNGHCVIYVAYDADLNLSAVTWGEVRPVSWEFHQQYCDEMYVALDPSWAVPAGVNLDKWRQAFAEH